MARHASRGPADVRSRCRPRAAPGAASCLALRERSPDAELELEELEAPADPIADDDLAARAVRGIPSCTTRACRVSTTRWEWSPALLPVPCRRRGARARARGVARGAERRAVARRRLSPAAAGGRRRGTAVSRYMESRGTLEQMCEHVIHRSAYQLKEADPHSWESRACMGSPRRRCSRSSSTSTAGAPRSDALRAVREDDGGPRARPGVRRVSSRRLPGITLQPSTCLRLRVAPASPRRTRGAPRGLRDDVLDPNRRYGNALRRLGLGPDVTDFYDEHVEAGRGAREHRRLGSGRGAGSAPSRTWPRTCCAARALLLALEGRWASHSARQLDVRSQLAARAERRAAG